MFYLIKIFSDNHPEFIKNLNGLVIQTNDEFDNLTKFTEEIVTKNEVHQCKISLEAIGSYYSEGFRLSIVDKIEFQMVFPELYKLYILNVNV